MLKTKGSVDVKRMGIISILPLLAAFVWGVGFVAQVISSGSIQPFFYNATRNILAVVSLIPIIFIFERKHSASYFNSIYPAFVCGSVLFLAQSLQQVGLVLTLSSAKGGFITSLYAVLVPFIEYFIYGRRFSNKIWLAVMMSLIGLFLIFLGSSGSSELLNFKPGDIFLLLNALMYAFHIIVIDRYIDRVRPIFFSAMQFLFTSILSFLCTILFEAPTLTALSQSIIPIVYGGVFSIAVGYTLQVLSQKNHHVVLTSIMFSTESSFAAIGGFLILGEKMSLVSSLGCILIFSGVVISQVSAKNKF